jgi:DNA helicase-2/ATP-dependent DNA helicase PcrA
VVAYARCPRQCYWTTVEPRRRAAGSAALLGSKVHRWIELLARRQPALFDVGPDAPTNDVDRAAYERLQAAFLATPFAALDPVAVEAPFALTINGRVIRGRVDAIYARADRIELVDFKTGRAAHTDDPGSGVQLDVYALAAVDVWRHEPASLRTTYCYLDGGDLVSRDFDDARIAAVRDRVAGYLAQFGAAMFEPNPGGWCTRCDFRDICPAVGA